MFDKILHSVKYTFYLQTILTRGAFMNKNSKIKLPKRKRLNIRSNEYPTARIKPSLTTEEKSNIDKKNND
jgi:hypothetical protein